MGLGTARKGDISNAHNAWPERPSIEGSDNVFINGIPAHAVGHKWASHTRTKKPRTTHSGALARGAARVYVNNRQLGYIGAPINCPGDEETTVKTGSSDVFVNPY